MIDSFGFQVQSAIDKRAVDVHFLFWVAGGRALCAAAEHVLGYVSAKAQHCHRSTVSEVLLGAHLPVHGSPRCPNVG